MSIPRSQNQVSTVFLTLLLGDIPHTSWAGHRGKASAFLATRDWGQVCLLSLGKRRAAPCVLARHLVLKGTSSRTERFPVFIWLAKLHWLSCVKQVPGMCEAISWFSENWMTIFKVFLYYSQPGCWIKKYKGLKILVSVMSALKETILCTSFSIRRKRISWLWCDWR